MNCSLGKNSWFILNLFIILLVLVSCLGKYPAEAQKENFDSAAYADSLAQIENNKQKNLADSLEKADIIMQKK